MAADEFEWEVKAFDKLDDGELVLVAEFFNEHFPGVFYPKCTPEIFKWKLGDGNPAGRGFLTVATNQGRVVGTASGTRRELISHGMLVQGMEIGDTFTHLDFRKKGAPRELYSGKTNPEDYLNKSIFGRLVTETLDRASQSGVEYVFGTPNENSRPPYLSRLEFNESGWGRVRAWHSPTSSFSPPLRFAWVFRTLLSTLKVVRKISCFFALRNISIDEDSIASIINDPKNFPPESDSFTLNRKLDFLKHRYGDHPTYDYRYYKVRKKNRVLGWLITVRVVRSSGRRTLVLSDWITRHETFEPKIPALLTAVAALDKETELISVWMQNNRLKSWNWFTFCFVSRKDVSLIEKRLSNPDGRIMSKLENFKFGWSDNG